jgi:NADH-quinone oxidoreductase subunit A
MVRPYYFQEKLFRFREYSTRGLIFADIKFLLMFQVLLDATQVQFLSIGIQLLFAIGFVTVMIFVSSLLGPKRATSDKLENFESGIEQIGNARQPMAVKYFLVAILFVLFDVEVIFFYPYAVNFRQLGWQGFGAVLMFVAFFLVGFFYIIKKGALNWED